MDGWNELELPEEHTQRVRLGVGAIALGWCAIYGWFSFVKSADVPILWYLQLAVHEMGHRVFAPFGEYVSILMGSGSEILFPFLLGVGCIVWKRKRNLIAAGMCWAVAAAACEGTAIYMADAPVGHLQLIGSDQSDWLRIFDEFWDKLYRADVYAARTRTAGIAIWFAAVALVVVGMLLAHRGVRRAERPGPSPTAKPKHELVAVPDERMWS